MQLNAADYVSDEEFYDSNKENSDFQSMSSPARKSSAPSAAQLLFPLSRGAGRKSSSLGLWDDDGLNSDDADSEDLDFTTDVATPTSTRINSTAVDTPATTLGSDDETSVRLNRHKRAGFNRLRPHSQSTSASVDSKEEPSLLHRRRHLHLPHSPSPLRPLDSSFTLNSNSKRVTRSTTVTLPPPAFLECLKLVASGESSVDVKDTVDASIGGDRDLNSNDSSASNDSDEGGQEDDDSVDSDDLDRAKNTHGGYFEGVSWSRRKTKGRGTLSTVPSSDVDLFADYLLPSADSDSTNLSKKHQNEKQALMTHHRRAFPQWKFELCERNLMFYGIGSKKHLLDEFARSLGDDGMKVVVLSGFHPSIGYRDFLLFLLERVFHCFKHTKGSLLDLTDALTSLSFSSNTTKPALVIVIHNLDGVGLRKEAIQVSLSQLASSNHIRLVASMDHIQAPLMWDRTKMSRFGWVYHDVTTYDEYALECAFENGFATLLQRGVIHMGSDHAMISRIRVVLASLTGNARKMFEVLVREQVENAIGLCHEAWYRRCRENFIITNQVVRFRVSIDSLCQ